MLTQFSRTELLLGKEAMDKLAASRVAVFGVGGVGGHCVDALVRCGLGRIAIFDSAKVKPSNLNRQICAKKSTVGMKKVEAMSLHIADVSRDHRTPHLSIPVTAWL